MINLKALSLALGAVSLLGSPALASLTRYTNTQLLNSGVHPGIVRGFDSLNVPVFDGAAMDICQMTDNVRPIAFYNFKLNAVLVCSQNVKSADEFISSVTHEAVHMVQDCRSGLNSPTLHEQDEAYLAQLYSRLHPDLQENIKAAYERDDWSVEIEAFYFQSRPAAVAEGISKFCF